MSYPSPIFYKMGEGFSFACLSDFIKKCIIRSQELNIPLTDGVCFEEVLGKLKTD